MDGMGERLRWCRTQHGWTQRDLAAATGVGLATIRRIEQRAFAPRLATVQRLAARLHVREGWLAFGEAPMLDPGDLTAAEQTSGGDPVGGDRPGTSPETGGTPGPWYRDDDDWRVDRRAVNDEGSTR